MQLSGGNLSRPTQSVEVIEELIPLPDTRVTLRLPRAVKRATLEPQGVECPFENSGDRLTVSVDAFSSHQMVALHY